MADPVSVQPVDHLLLRLRKLAGEHPAMKDAAGIYGAIIPILRNARIGEGAVSITAEEAREKMGEGRPLLSGIELDIDIAALHDLMMRLALAIESAGSPQKIGARNIRIALEEKKLDLGDVFPSLTEYDPGPARSAAHGLGLDPELLSVLFQNGLKPALRSWCGQLSPLAGGIPWQKGYCFICGATPSLAELQGNDQDLHLRCSSCGADWKFNRMRCIYCGNDDHNTRGYLYQEGRTATSRVETCEKCKGYLKIVTAFEPALPEMLAVADLETLYLDFIARERGYIRRSAC